MSVSAFPLSHVREWSATEQTFSLDLGNYDDILRLRTNQGDRICAYLSDYIDFLQRKVFTALHGTEKPE